MVWFLGIIGLLFLPTVLLLFLNRKRPVKQMVCRTGIVQALVLLVFVLWQPVSYGLSGDLGFADALTTMLTWYEGDGVLGLALPAITAVLSAITVVAVVRWREKR